VANASWPAAQLHSAPLPDSCKQIIVFYMGLMLVYAPLKVITPFSAGKRDRISPAGRGIITIKLIHPRNYEEFEPIKEE
jgi:hypothetical protein